MSSVKRRRGGLVGWLARAAGRGPAPEPPPTPPEVSVLLPEPEAPTAPSAPEPPPGEARDAAELARRLDAARERLQRAIPPPES